ncbi:hypothetical protein TWF718_005920 [Orbilia javanica]|uniref:Uncharacterized protein n=1 Tax=Orbilia javanica TaxID=47235 RepID=A0AAN8N8G4_9PEZI
MTTGTGEPEQLDKGKAPVRPGRAHSVEREMTPESPCEWVPSEAVEPPAPKQYPTEMELDSGRSYPASSDADSLFTRPPSECSMTDSLPIPDGLHLSAYYIRTPPADPEGYTGIKLPPLLPENLRRVAERRAAAALGLEEPEEKLPTMESWRYIDALEGGGSLTGKINYVYRIWETSLAQSKFSEQPPRNGNGDPSARN